MLPPDSVENIRKVLDADLHALPVWAVRALRLLLDEREHLIAGAVGEPVTSEIVRVRRRLELARELLPQWRRQAEVYAHEHEGADYQLGVARGIRMSLDDLRSVLEGELG